MRIVNRRGRGRPRHPDILTPAEWRVYVGMRVGKTNALIARDQHLSIHTVRSHVSSILGKLGASTRRELPALEATMTESERNPRCSFCQRSEHDVEELVAGPAGVHVCDRCVDACNRIISEHRQKAG